MMSSFLGSLSLSYSVIKYNPVPFSTNNGIDFSSAYKTLKTS